MCAHPSRVQLPAKLSVVLCLTLTAYLGGCASQLSPQRYSSGLLTTSNNTGSDSSDVSGVCGTSPSKSLTQALKCAEDLQRQYITAQRDLSEISPTLSNGLIAWSGLTLLSATVNPHVKDLAAMGILGSTAYAMGSRTPASARVKVFAAGVDALNCAVTAVAPLLPLAGHEGVPGTVTTGNVWGDLAQAVQTSNALQAELIQLDELNQPKEISAAKPGSVSKPHCADPRPDCKPLASASVEDQARFAASCQAKVQKWERRCSPKTVAPVEAVIQQAHARIQQSFAAANAQLKESKARIEQTRLLTRALASAGNALWSKTLEIQNAVGLEVQRTEPEPDKVLAAINSLSSVGFSLSKSDLLKTSNAESARSPGKARNQATSLDADESYQLLALNQTIEAARTASDALQVWLLTADTKGKTPSMRSCKLGSLNVAVLPTKDNEPTETEAASEAKDDKARKTATPYVDFPKVWLDALGLKVSDPAAKFSSRIKQCQREEPPIPEITGEVVPGDATDQRLRLGICNKLPWQDQP